MRGALDEAARAHGLSDARDWMVLSALSTGPRQTQLALAHSPGLLGAFSAGEQDLLRELLARLTEVVPGECLKVSGSCS